jgi:hypothetical protein
MQKKEFCLKFNPKARGCQEQPGRKMLGAAFFRAGKAFRQDETGPGH